MTRRKGFTLMELLLVVAVLAIVAAAAAPAFFGGATDAMNEAKRAAYLSAYSNTLSGANLLLSIEASKGGGVPAGLIPVASLTYFVPAPSRTFKNGANPPADVTLNAVVKTDGSVDVIRGTTVTQVVSAADVWDPTIKGYTN